MAGGWQTSGEKGTFAGFLRPSSSWRTLACNYGNPRKTEVRAGGQRLGAGWGGEWGSNLSTRSPSPFVTVETPASRNSPRCWGCLGVVCLQLGPKERQDQSISLVTLAPLPPNSCKLDLFLLGLCLGGVDGESRWSALATGISSFFSSEISD